MTIFTGSGVALITPFNDDQEKTVNYEMLEKLINWQIEEGTDAILICGTTGESSTLSNDEHVEVLKRAAQIIDGRVPMIAGAGSNDTAHGIWLSQQAQEAGADALLHVTNYYNKTSQKGLYEHFTAIADSVDLPIILYNVPSRTNMNILPETQAKLSKHKNIVGVKEASGDLAQVLDIRNLTDEDYAIYSGNDDITIPVMASGGSGVISVLANICPKDTHDMVQAWLDGDHDKALKLQLKYQPLVRALFVESNPIPVKAAMKLMGMDVGGYRLPLTEPSDSTVEILKDEMKKVGLI